MKLNSKENIMRKVIILFVAIASQFAQPAQAQSAGDVLRALGNSSLSYGCWGDGLNKTLCRLGQIGSIARTLDRSKIEHNVLELQAASRQGNVVRALAAACEAGDQQSCSRVNTMGMNPRAVSAVINACQAGDRISCQRLMGEQGRR